MNVVIFIPFIGISVAVSIIVNKCIISKYEGSRKKVLYAVNVVVFILAGLSVFTISRIQNRVNAIIIEKANLLEEIIITADPENVLITSGINIEKVQDGIDELRQLLPASIIDDDGIFALIIEQQYNKYVDVVFYRLESKVSLVTQFAEDGILTLSSFIAAIENIALSYCNKAFLIAYLIVLAVVGIYLACCVFMRKEDLFSYNKSITFGGDT